jgi:hypothetical protein
MRLGADGAAAHYAYKNLPASSVGQHYARIFQATRGNPFSE